MAKLLTPLANNVPIVDDDGNPTPYFQRVMQELTDARVSASLIDALGGDPGSNQIVTWDETTNDLDFKSLSDVLDFIGSAAHGDVLYRDSAAWARLVAGTDGDVLTTHGAGADPTWETPSTGGGAAWALAGSGQTATGVWDQAVDGTLANVDFTGLSGFSDILIIARSVTKSVSTPLCIQVSVNNGSTFYSTSGDYILTSTAGAESNQNHFGQVIPGNNTAARTGSIILPGINLSGVPKVSDQIVANNGAHFFVASTSPIDAVRLLGIGGGNLTGGKIYCLAR